MQAESLGHISLADSTALHAARSRMQALLRQCGLNAFRVDFLSTGFTTWCHEMAQLGARSVQLSFLNRNGGAALLVDAQRSVAARQQPYAGTRFFEHFVQNNGSVRIFIPLSEGLLDRDALNGLRELMAYKTRDELMQELQEHRKHLQDEVAAQTAALRASETQVRAMLEGSPVAVRVAASADGRLLFVNQSFADLCRCTREDLLSVGPMPTDAPGLGAQRMDIDTDARPDIQAALTVGRDVLNCPASLHTASGELLHMVVSYINISYDATPAVLTWLYDVTDLRRAKEQAEEAMRVRTDFMANMSHELRTPLNAIIGMSHLTLQSSLTPQQTTFVGKIHKAGKSLMGIVNDILDFSKVENGQITLAAREFALDDVLTQLRDDLQERADAKGLAFSIDTAPDVPLDLIGDARRLAQVLNHLVANAIKFTHSGSVAVQVTVLAQSEGRCQLQCSVRDTGVGLSLEQRQKLFQAFSQGDGSSTRRFGGTGLGLVICQQLLVLMDGGIWADSEPGKGSEFVFDAWLGCAPDARYGGEPSPTALNAEAPEPNTAARLEPPAAPAPTQAWALTPQALARMRSLLEDSDAEALDHLADLPVDGAPATLQPLLRQLAHAVEEFDFKDALVALDGIEEALAAGAG